MKTQLQKVLEVLQFNYQKWLPTHFFVGNRRGIEGDVFLSYKAPARLSEIYKQFPDHIERKRQVNERTKYYSYKLTKKIYGKSN